MNSEKKKLLLIEDDIIDQKAFKRFADQAGFPYDYDISGSVKEAKKSLKSNRYDVILADYSLGDGTAFDVLKDLESIPMVIVTGTGDEEVAVKAIKLGAYDYLIKDVEGNYLKMIPVTIENAIKRFRAEQSLLEYHENLEKLVDERTVELKKEIIEHKQAEEALRIERDNLKNIFEAIEDGVYIVNQQYDIQYVNPVLAKNFGVYEGRKCYEYFHDRTKECPWCKNPDVFAGKTVRWEWFSSKNRKTYDLIDTPLKNPDGSISKLEIFRDITKRKLAEDTLRESERRLKESQEIARIGQWELDLVNNQLYWSDGIYDLFEIDPDKFAASYEAFLNAIHPEDREFVNKAYSESVKNKTPYDIIHRLLLKDGKIKYVNEICRTEYDKDGNPIRSIGTMQDITELKQVEEELKKHREHLEELVKERTKELEIKNKKITESQQALAYLLEDMNESSELLQKTNEQLKMANKEMEAFAYSVSHDLRAPLRAIDGFSEILSDDYKDKLDEEAKRLINVIRKNTRDMNQLITDLLNFSRIGRQQVKTVKINMKNLAREVFVELRQIYPKREIKFKLGEIPSATGDSNLIRLVFTNLLSNAIKFSGHKKVPEIEIGFREKDRQTLYYVKDNGVGFDMEYIDKIFGVFQRLHTSEEFEGTGVGLAIVQKIIYKHGGKVTAEGKVNKGATFYFSLQKE